MFGDEEKTMFEMRKGFSVPFSEKIIEGYRCENGIMTANVSAEKTNDVLEHFINDHEDEELFFILELPTSERFEPKDEKGNITALHKDVYYIDGCTAALIRDILDIVGGLLLDDGMVQYGIGSHASSDEIMICKYNEVVLFGERTDGFFEQHGIFRDDNLVSAWDTFTAQHSGICTRAKKDGRTVYDIPAIFAELGMYMAQRREDS